MDIKNINIKINDKLIQVPVLFIDLCSKLNIKSKRFNTKADIESFNIIISFYKFNKFEKYYIPNKKIKFLLTDYKIPVKHLEQIESILLNTKFNLILKISIELGLTNFIQSISAFLAYQIKKSNFNYSESKRSNEFNDILNFINKELI